MVKSRRPFLKNLVYQLVVPWLKKRYERKDLKTATKRAIRQVLEEVDPEFVAKQVPVPTKRGVSAVCFICVSEDNEMFSGEELKRKKKNRNKQKWFCPKCNAAVCRKHRINLLGSLQLVCKACAIQTENVMPPNDDVE